MKKSKNYVWGALILTVGSLISKFLGIFFKIPLTNIMGDYGMGLYGYAYPLYVTFLTVSTAGLPSAVSKMVAESVSSGNHRQAYRIFRVAFFTLAVLGISSSLIMFFSARWFIDTFNWDPLAYRSIIALSIAPFFVCLISVVRGFFQGMQMMVYTSVSEILEQVGRVGVGVSLAIFWFRTRGVDWGAAGATFGAVAGAILAFVFLYISFFIYRRKNRPDVLMQSDDIKVESQGAIFRSLILIALPIALSSIVSNMMDLIDSGTIPRCLSMIGYTHRQITDLYGQLTSKAQTLVNVPMVLGSSLAVSLVPAISESMARSDRDKAVSKVTLAVKLTFLVSLPAALGLSLLSRPIIELLYPNSVTGFEILRWHAFTVIFSMGMLVLQGILQGAGKYYVPLINVLIGGAVKLMCNLVLIRIPELNIYGAIMSTVIAAFVIFTLNFIAVRRHIGFGNLFVPLVKILLSVAVMGVLCFFSFRWMCLIISPRIAVLGSIALSIVVYALMVLVTKAVTMDDLRSVRS